MLQSKQKPIALRGGQEMVGTVGTTIEFLDIRRMRNSESVAKRLLEIALPGRRLTFHEDQSQRICDFAIWQNAKRVGGVEVTSLTNGDLKATEAALDRHRNFARVLCRQDCRIHPETDANVKLISADVDRYLAAIEADGLTRVRASTDASQYPSVAAIYGDLGIRSGQAMSLNVPGISVALPVTGGAYAPSILLEAVREVAWKDDNREKLARAGGEGHLAIYVDRTQTAELMALRDLEPTGEPVLPPEVLNLWVFSESYEQDR